MRKPPGRDHIQTLADQTGRPERQPKRPEPDSADFRKSSFDPGRSDHATDIPIDRMLYAFEAKREEPTLHERDMASGVRDDDMSCLCRPIGPTQISSRISPRQDFRPSGADRGAIVVDPAIGIVAMRLALGPPLETVRAAPEFHDIHVSIQDPK